MISEELLTPGNCWIYTKRNNAKWWTARMWLEDQAAQVQHILWHCELGQHMLFLCNNACCWLPWTVPLEIVAQELNPFQYLFWKAVVLTGYDWCSLLFGSSFVVVLAVQGKGMMQLFIQKKSKPSLHLQNESFAANRKRCSNLDMSDD